MPNKITYITPRYKIPKPYTYPVLYAINLTKPPLSLSLDDAIDTSYKLYTNRNFKQHIPKTEFNKKLLIFHTRKYIDVELKRFK